jgi:hypothetical protein
MIQKNTICARPGCHRLLSAVHLRGRRRYCSSICAHLSSAILFRHLPTRRVLRPAPADTDSWIGGAPAVPLLALLARESGYRYYHTGPSSTGMPIMVYAERGSYAGETWRSTERPHVYCALSEWEHSTAFHRIGTGEQGANMWDVSGLGHQGLKGESL